MGAGVSNLRRLVHSRGRRLTRQRCAVYQALHNCDGHPCAEEVYRRVRTELPKISLATVYKALEFLVSVGLAAKLKAGDGPTRFDRKVSPHIHVRSCSDGRMDDVPDGLAQQVFELLEGEVFERVRRELGFRVLGFSLEFMGDYD